MLLDSNMEFIYDLFQLSSLIGKHKCFHSGLNEYLMKIDRLNEIVVLVSDRSSSYISPFLNHKTMENDLLSANAHSVNKNKKTRNQRNWNVEQLDMQRN